MVNKKKLEEAMKYNPEDDTGIFFKDTNVIFYDGLDESKFKLYGSGVVGEKTYYRFSNEELKKIASVSNDVHWLATHSSGLSLHFKSNSRLIKLRVLGNDAPNMRNMEFMAQCGFDLYYKEDGESQYHFHNPTFPCYIDVKKYMALIGAFRDKKEREFILYFPLYSGVLSLEIGLEEDSYSLPSFIEDNKRIVCYGTSILQGGCASRPGLATTNVISRVLNKDVLNYGFSGAGLLEKEVGEIIASRSNIDLLIIDAEANAGCDKWMAENFELFLNEFYKNYPELKVIVMNKIQMNIDEYIPRNKRIKDYYESFLRRMVNKYKKKGKEIYFVDNYHLFNNKELHWSEYTVDGVHPNDLGMYYLNKNYLKAIRKVLNIK